VIIVPVYISIFMYLCVCRHATCGNGYVYLYVSMYVSIYVYVCVITVHDDGTGVYLCIYVSVYV